jgi:hypothetical protein
MDAGEWVSAALGGAGLLLAAFVASRQLRVQEQLARMQARLAAIETARRGVETEARWHARIRVASRPGRTHDSLVVANDGPARARVLAVRVEAEDRGSPPELDGLEALPADLQAGDRLPFPLRRGSTATVLQALVSWTDDAGEHEQRFTVTER